MDDIELLDVGNKLGNKPKDTETLVNETSGRYEDFSQESHAVSTRVLDVSLPVALSNSTD